MGYVGLRLGLSSELVKLAGIISGFFLSFRYYQAIGDALAQRSFLSMEWAAALVMVVLVLAVYCAVTLILRLAEKLVQLTFQAKLNQLGGLLVGLLRAGLVASVILVALKQLPSPVLNASIEEKSLSGHILSGFAPAFYDAVGPRVNCFVTSVRSS